MLTISYFVATVRMANTESYKSQMLELVGQKNLVNRFSNLSCMSDAYLLQKFDLFVSWTWSCKDEKD